jgi:cytochrome c-type biogenesis protein CcmE
MMKRNRRFLIGGLIVLGALAYIIYGGMQEAIVYFVTPSELKAKESTPDRFVRMGGMVVKGSLKKDLQNLTYRFELTDGTASVPVFFRGVPPDLFTEGKGAVVEGRLTDGVFHATTIMAKHAEEYSPHPDSQTAYPKSFVPGKESTDK